MSERICGQCGQPLQQIVSVASDGHDEPVWHCDCWPFDWQAAVMQVAIIAIMVGVFWLITLLVLP